jgi:ribosomal protein L40E
MGGLDIIEILKAVAGISISLLLVAGVVVGIIFLIRSSRKGSSTAATPHSQGDVLHASAPKPEEKPPATAQLVCGECGAANPPGNNFCEQCGANLK